MLHWLLSGWQTPALQLEITLDASPSVRAVLAALAALAVVLAAGRPAIAWLSARLPTRIKRDSARLAALQAHKAGTPSMGGVLIVGAMLLSTCLLADLTQPLTWSLLLVTLAFAGLGAIDDLLKVVTGGQGLPARFKLLAQCAAALAGAAIIRRALLLEGADLALVIPGAEWTLDPGMFFVPLAMLAIVGSANAVNLTDGLDGLAGGCVIFAAAALAVAATSCQLLTAGASETPVLLGGLAGAVLGFLWFNCAPARVFMGDTGSLAIGSLLGAAAVALRQELLLVLLGGVFVIETVSVIIQVVGYRLTRRRVFACAPLHHHYQFRGWTESQIVTRFWAASMICATLGVALAARGAAQSPELLTGLARTPASATLSIAESAAVGLRR